MTKGKNSFVIYYDLEEQTQDFSNEQLGKLLRAAFAYEKRDELVDIDDPVVKAAFSFVRVQLREGKHKYEERCEKNKAAADKRWEGQYR